MVIIDGSEKNLTHIKEDFTTADDRIRFIDIQHSGVSVAQNCGIENSTGTYLAFIDSDDYVDEVFIEKLYQGIQRADLSICGVAEQFFPTADALYRYKNFLFSSSRI